jgi:flagellin-like protein
VRDGFYLEIRFLFRSRISKPYAVEDLQNDLEGELETKLQKKERKEGGKRKNMSAKTKRIERSQRFRRLRRGENRAVSPVVATLILILIAVAAAAALYLWLVAWQGGVTAGIGSPGAQSTLSIGGSTSVFPFSQVAVTQFEQNNTDVVISNNQGGTGAGLAAVCSGQVDIGAASAPEVDSALVTNDGCPQTVVQEIVAYDGVDAIVPTNNAHGLQSISWDTLQAIYVAASTTPGSATTNLHLAGAYTMGNGAASQTGTPVLVATPAAAGFAWDQIPACAQATAALGCAGVTEQVSTVAVTGTTTVPGTETACGTNDLCSPVGDASTCGWTVCAGGTAANPATNTIVTEARSDVSGTTQSFIARLLAVGASGTTPAGIGFSGCSGDNQFDGCSLTNAHTADGNPAVISAVAGNPDAIGYASDGLAQTAGSGVVPVNFQGYGQTSVVVIVGESTALKAIASGIASGTSGTYGAQSYVGWRPFVYIETAPPTGETLRYLQFVMDPANNENFAAQSAEISVYASGLAGVVPVTPIPS